MRAAWVLACGVMLCTLATNVDAQRRGGGGGSRGGGGMRGGGMSRGGARPSVSRPSGGFSRPSGGFSRPSGGINRPSTPNIDRGNINRGNVVNGGDFNRNTNIVDRNNNIVNRPVNVDDVNINRGYGWNDGYNGCCYHPVAAAAAIGTAAAVTAAAIGSVVYTLPSDCVTSYTNGMTYMQCGSTWYEPQFVGTDASYVVVNPPQ